MIGIKKVECKIYLFKETELIHIFKSSNIRPTCSLNITISQWATHISWVLIGRSTDTSGLPSIMVVAQRWVVVVWNWHWRRFCKKKGTFLDLISWDQRQTSQFVVDSLRKSVSSSLLDLDSAWLKHVFYTKKNKKQKNPQCPACVAVTQSAQSSPANLCWHRL